MWPMGLLFSLHNRQGPSADNLSAETKQILEEITRYLNLEKLLPCYRHTVTVRFVTSNTIPIA